MTQFASFKIGNTSGTTYEVVDASYLYSSVVASYPAHWWGKVNSVILPRGRKPGEAHLLVKQSSITALGLNSVKKIVIENQGSSINLTGWYPYECEAVDQDQTEEQVFYLHLKDRRQIGELCTVGKIHSANPATHQEEYPNPTYRTWQQTIGDYWAAMPAGAHPGSTVSTVPTLAATPSSTPKNILMPDETHWGAITKLVHSSGHIPVFNPVSDSYSFVDPTATQSGLSTFYTNNAGLLIWDFEAPNVSSGTCPEKVGIYFSGNSSGRSTNELAFYPGEERETTTGITGALSGTTYFIHDTTKVQYDTSNAVSNSSELDNRMTDLGRYLKGIARAINSRIKRVYSGILSILPGEQVTQVTWKQGRDGRPVTIVDVSSKWEIELPKASQSPPHRLYRYTLSSGWTSLTATAAIKDMDGNSLYTGATVRDPLSMFTDQTSGANGFCELVDGRFYCLQAPC